MEEPLEDGGKRHQPSADECAPAGGIPEQPSDAHSGPQTSRFALVQRTLDQDLQAARRHLEDERDTNQCSQRPENRRCCRTRDHDQEEEAAHVGTQGRRANNPTAALLTTPTGPTSLPVPLQDPNCSRRKDGPGRHLDTPISPNPGTKGALACACQRCYGHRL